MNLHAALDQLSRGRIALHRHWNAYATIVRQGGYAEAAIEGRVTVGPGALVLHPNFHLHSDIVPENCTTWNVPLGDRVIGGWRVLQGRAVEELAAMSRAPEPDEVLEVIGEAEAVDFMPVPAWIEDISRLDNCDFAAAQREVSREHAHRTFKKHFGMPPGQYRRERQVQRAISMFRSTEPLADIAVAAGFSDQSHMTRIIVREFGQTPAALRAKITPVQECVR